MSLPPAQTLPPAVPLLLIAANCAAFLAFGIDKFLAAARARRIPERALLLLAALGGTPGAYAGRGLFRHKTRKQPFLTRLHAIAVAQLVVLAALWLMR